MKILVTGATGFLGRPLLKALLLEGHEIVVLSRSAARAKKQLGFPLSAFDWTPTEGPPPAEAFEGVNAVVHLAGESVAGGRWTSSKKKRILESRELGTRHLVQGMKTHGTAIHTLVSASAIGIYGERGDERLVEDSPRGEGFLADVCEAWEREASASDARTVLLRIGLVLGQEGALAKLLPLFRAGLGGTVGSGKQWMSWIHVQDLVGLIQKALTTPSLNGVVNGVAPNPVTNREFTRALGKAVGRPTLLPAPAWGLKVALGEMAELALKSQRVLNESITDYEWKYPTIEAALKEVVPSPDRRHEERFTTHQWLDRPVEDVFPFFCDAGNLELITPPWLHFRVEDDVDSNIHEGQTIRYRLKIRQIPVRWKTLIEKWEPNQEFVDTQIKGPYRRWHHTHTFDPVQNGTLITDTVRYEVPGGLVGAGLLGSWIRKDIETIFDYRRRAIEERYPSGT